MIFCFTNIIVWLQNVAFLKSQKVSPAANGVGRRFRHLLSSAAEWCERSERRNLHRSMVNFNVNAFFATEAYADLQRVTILSSITPLRARDSVWLAFTCETTFALARPNGMEGTISLAQGITKNGIHARAVHTIPPPPFRLATTLFRKRQTTTSTKH